MTQEAWSDDPYLGVHDSDDPDSRALKKGLKMIFWPWPSLLIVCWAAAIIFKAGWAGGILLFATSIWIGAHLLFRPRQFLSDIVVAGGWFADRLSRLMKTLNRAAKASAPKTDAVRSVVAAAPPAPAPESAPASAPQARQPRNRHPIDWGKLLSVLLNPKVIIGIVVLIFIIFVLRGLDAINPFSPPSGAEVAADARADVAEANESTANAETEQLAAALRRVEAAAERAEQLNREAERARHAIQNAPDLDSGIAVHRDYVERVRGDAAAARASAVSDYGSTIDP
jgi:hypothetical protein